MQLHLEIDDDLLSLLGSSTTAQESALRELTVFELFRRGEISGGKGAEILGLSRLAFIQRAAQLDIPYFNYTPDELERELGLLDGK